MERRPDCVCATVTVVQLSSLNKRARQNLIKLFLCDQHSLRAKGTVTLSHRQDVIDRCEYNSRSDHVCPSVNIQTQWWLFFTVNDQWLFSNHIMGWSSSRLLQDIPGHGTLSDLWKRQCGFSVEMNCARILTRTQNYSLVGICTSKIPQTSFTKSNTFSCNMQI